MIVGPLGEIRAGPLVDGKRILTADIDIDDLLGARLNFDPIGHYARPNLFSLRTDERPQWSVLALKDGADSTSVNTDKA